jgi:hypothetical protein
MPKQFSNAPVPSTKDGKGASSSDTIPDRTSGRAIDAGPGDNRIFGAENREFLFGNNGSDHISGGAGNDRIFGGRGHDFLTGGDGADTFVFEQRRGNDTILDFDQADGDKIEIRGFFGWALAHSNEYIDIVYNNDATIINAPSGDIYLRGFMGTLSDADFVLSW